MMTAESMSSKRPVLRFTVALLVLKLFLSHIYCFLKLIVYVMKAKRFHNHIYVICMTVSASSVIVGRSIVPRLLSRQEPEYLKIQLQAVPNSHKFQLLLMKFW